MATACVMTQSGDNIVTKFKLMLLGHHDVVIVNMGATLCTMPAPVMQLGF